METCTVCEKERPITHACTLDNGYTGRICPNCAVTKWNRMLVKIAIGGAVVVAALIVGESRGLMDTLILIGIYLVFLFGAVRLQPLGDQRHHQGLALCAGRDP